MDKKEYQKLTIPQLTWNKSTLSELYGELVAQPLEPGFGITLGNALRRVLLGAVEGTAVTAVIIKGVNNQFSAVPGVVEDSMQLVLNSKQLIVKNKTGEPGKMRLHVVGEAVVTGANIETDDHLEIVNKDYIFAHVAAEGSLTVEFFVENGRGYVPAQWSHEKPYHEDGKIYVDALFSPIKRVSFEVTKTRVGEYIDYDKLQLFVHTDGSENPVDVVHYAVSVLRTQLQHFLDAAEIPFNELSTPEPVASKETITLDEVSDSISELSSVDSELLLKPIEVLELPVRAHNCLISAGIVTVKDLVNLREEDTLKIKNFGRKSLTEVCEILEARGLKLNMNID